MTRMTSNRPYLVRALFEWILDNGMTPYLLVDAGHPGAMVPEQFVKDGKIVLNISPSAVHELVLGNEIIDFDARFGGVARKVQIPVDSVLGIYASENGQGMLFPSEAPVTGEMQDSDEEPGPPEPPPQRPTLKVVK
jgi:stringent starvation protein B